MTIACLLANTVRAAVRRLRGTSAADVRVAKVERLSEGNSSEHDPEKWKPVFGKRSCSNQKLDFDPIQFNRIKVWGNHSKRRRDQSPRRVMFAPDAVEEWSALPKRRRPCPRPCRQNRSEERADGAAAQVSVENRRRFSLSDSAQTTRLLISALGPGHAAPALKTACGQKPRP